MANTRVDDANPAMAGGWDTQHYAAVIVFGAMAFLYFIRRGFRGLSVGGVSLNAR
jgi:hypothetical protein